jgi:hypothetical protein
MQNKKEIKIVDNIPGAEYANAMQVNHNKDEFQLYYLNLMGMNGRSVGKIIVSPGHYKRMLSAMTENLKKYEEKFGVVEEVKELNQEIGFKN